MGPGPTPWGSRGSQSLTVLCVLPPSPFIPVPPQLWAHSCLSGRDLGPVAARECSCVRAQPWAPPSVSSAPSAVGVRRSTPLTTAFSRAGLRRMPGPGGVCRVQVHRA